MQAWFLLLFEPLPGSELIQVLDPFQVSHAVRHTIFSKGLVHVVHQTCDLVPDKAYVHTLELLQHFSGDDVIHTAKLRSAAGHIDRDEIIELLHDTVSERKLETGGKITVEPCHFLHHLVADRMLLPGPDEKLLEILCRDIAGRMKLPGMLSLIHI